MKKIILLAIVSLLLVGALAVYSFSNASLKLDRLGGGTVINPIYSIKVSANGNVLYNGKRAKITGEKKSKIDRKKARKLILDFIAIKPLQLENSYKSTLSKDAPYVIITFNLFFYQKKIIFDEITAPDSLIGIAEKIDNETNSMRWVFADEQ